MLVVYTGDGKGKTSAALGNAFRALGHGQRVLLVQFFKGEWPVVFGETVSAKKHPRLEVMQTGRGFVKIMGDKKPMRVHREAAQRTFDAARKKILSARYDLAILDEALYALGYIGVRLLRLKDVLRLVDRCPKKTHLVLTGRRAPKAILKKADLITEMKEVKHPFQKGIPAQKGIDY